MLTKTPWRSLGKRDPGTDLPPKPRPTLLFDSAQGGDVKTGDNAGRGTVGKVAVAGIKDRETNKVNAKVVNQTDSATLHGFVIDRTETEAKVYTDEARAYNGLPRDRECG